MKALVFHRPGHVEVNDVPDPVIEESEDIILRVTSTAICGSDLRIYNGFFPQPKDMVLGHEFMGIIEDKGNGVRDLNVGDRVVVPFPVACGTCFFLGEGFQAIAKTPIQNTMVLKVVSLTRRRWAVRYTDLYGGYSGGQAQYVRVPYANFGPRKVAQRFRDEEVLCLTDIFPTGYSAIDWAGIKGGETVAVFGCGPVGLMAQKAAWLRGAGRVIGVDIEEYRLTTAAKAANSEPINAAEEDPVEAIRDLTEGRGADICVDAVGMEANPTLTDKLANIWHVQIGSIKALKNAVSAVRRGGFVSVIGVYGSRMTPFR